jgi:hypothetical protein
LKDPITGALGGVEVAPGARDVVDAVRASYTGTGLPVAGVYCVVLDLSIDATEVSPQATLGVKSANAGATSVYATPANGSVFGKFDCPPNSVAVALKPSVEGDVHVAIP